MSESTRKPKKRHDQDPEETKQKRRQAPGRTIESREGKLISLSYDLAEERILKKTATGQEVIHFLRLGSTIANLERVKLENENLLLQAKAEALKSQKRIEELYSNALDAMKKYSGQEDTKDDED